MDVNCIQKGVGSIFCFAELIFELKDVFIWSTTSHIKGRVDMIVIVKFDNQVLCLYRDALTKVFMGCGNEGVYLCFFL